MNVLLLCFLKVLVLGSYQIGCFDLVQRYDFLGLVFSETLSLLFLFFLVKLITLAKPYGFVSFILSEALIRLVIWLQFCLFDFLEYTQSLILDISSTLYLVLGRPFEERLALLL